MDVSGSRVHVGVSFDRFLEDISPERCEVLNGAGAWVHCYDPPFQFTWIAPRDLDEHDGQDVRVEKARELVGSEPLDEIVFSLKH